MEKKALIPGQTVIGKTGNLKDGNSAGIDADVVYGNLIMTPLDGRIQRLGKDKNGVNVYEVMFNEFMQGAGKEYKKPTHEEHQAAIDECTKIRAQLNAELAQKRKEEAEQKAAAEKAKQEEAEKKAQAEKNALAEQNLLLQQQIAHQESVEKLFKKYTNWLKVFSVLVVVLMLVVLALFVYVYADRFEWLLKYLLR